MNNNRYNIRYLVGYCVAALMMAALIFTLITIKGVEKPVDLGGVAAFAERAGDQWQGPRYDVDTECIVNDDLRPRQAQLMPEVYPQGVLECQVSPWNSHTAWGAGVAFLIGSMVVGLVVAARSNARIRIAAVIVTVVAFSALSFGAGILYADTEVEVLWDLFWRGFIAMTALVIATIGAHETQRSVTPLR